MATLRTVTVGPTGDYSDLSTAEAGEQGDISLSTGTDEQVDFVCEAFQDTTPVTISGWTVEGPDNYIRVVAASGAEAVVPYSTSGTYRLECSVGPNGHCLRIEEPYTRIEKINVKATPSGQDGSFRYTGVWVPGTIETRVDRCYILGDFSSWGAGSTGAVGVYVAADIAGDEFIRNCVVHGWDYTTSSNAKGIDVINHTSGNTYADNNTIVNCGIGIEDDYSDVIARNNLEYGASDTGFNGSFNASSDYNASSDATAPGTNSLTNISDPFVDYANDDFHLASGSAPVDAGTDLSGTFTTDIDGETRTGTWDIGADEYVAAGGADVSGTGEAALPAFAASGSGDVLVAGTGAAALPALSADGAGAVGEDVVGTGVVALPSLGASGEGVVYVQGLGVAPLPALGSSGVGAVAVTGTGSAPLPALGASGYEVAPEVLGRSGMVLNLGIGIY